MQHGIDETIRRGYSMDRTPENEVLTQPSDIPDGRTYRHPESPYQALMETAPYDEPVPSRMEIAELLGVVREAFECMSHDDRLLLEAVIFERQSFRQLERRYGIGKSIIHRRYAAAILELRGVLIEYPVIVEYLNDMGDE